ncbi:helix-turn-helix transcriptional regulator [Saccharopolyspora sp. 6V]|uniref:helix-turn-helix domain-containing protein n=2 Tax=unclassified Saccharopolyspora TaxID=2646250 RepID=UPI001CD3F3EC|nr:helix-turn-helix transcriptional regulator [Saccharopolyspora sp. 6V]MCA1194967.1 helix-turn-helix domain-containing protein [Saccharopolyspora sp. 6V]
MAATAQRRHLGQWLRKLRVGAALSTTDAARRLGCSEAKIRHMEAGRSGAKKLELAALLDLYGADQAVRDEMEEIRRAGTSRGRWSAYRLPSWFAPYVDYETDASQVCTFELGIIPGLLQTEDYVREMHQVGRASLSGDTLDAWVSARLARQRRLLEEPRLELRVVLAEEALHRRVGGPDLMGPQLDHLISMSAQPNVIIQVLPYGAGAHACPHGSFVLLGFPDSDHESLGYMDTPIGGQLVDKPDEVATLAKLFDDVRSTALPVAGSTALIRGLRKELVDL